MIAETRMGCVGEFVFWSLSWSPPGQSRRCAA